MASHLEYLKNSYRAGKLAHAYVLSGNAKAQKEAALQGFLAELVGVSDTPMQHRGVRHPYGHADITRVEPEKDEITIKQIRDLKEDMQKTPWHLPLRVAVLAKAHAMNQKAQSAFLKVLEEPRGNAVFFLLAKHAGSLLDTIRSRSQELRFYTFLRKAQQGIGLADSLAKLSLAERFGKAKTLSENGEKTEQVLATLIRETRATLLQNLQNPQALKNARNFLALLLEVQNLLRFTQVNKRLALERVFLELPPR